jgi:hypothetical protein
VLSGLKAGDKVVSMGAFELDDGTKISPAEPKTKSATEDKD